MQYFDPKDIPSAWIAKAQLAKIELVSVEPQVESQRLSCLENVKKYIAREGGNIQFGWIFSVLGNVALKLTAHAVVKKSDGSLLCVTPNEFRSGKLKFSRDDSISTLIKNNYLPLKFVPLVTSHALEKYIALELEQDDLRLRNSGVVGLSDIQQIQFKAALLLPEVVALARQHTGRNDHCYCGSGKKRKKCCS